MIELSWRILLPRRCPNCRFDTKGLRSFVCPECGERLDSTPPPRWTRITASIVVVVLGLLPPAATLAAATGLQWARADPEWLFPSRVAAYSLACVAILALGWHFRLVCRSLEVAFGPGRFAARSGWLVSAVVGLASVGAVLWLLALGAKP